MARSLYKIASPRIGADTTSNKSQSTLTNQQKEKLKTLLSTLLTAKSNQTLSTLLNTTFSEDDKVCLSEIQETVRKIADPKLGYTLEDARELVLEKMVAEPLNTMTIYLYQEALKLRVIIDRGEVDIANIIDCPKSVDYLTEHSDFLRIRTN